MARQGHTYRYGNPRTSRYSRDPTDEDIELGLNESQVDARVALKPEAFVVRIGGIEADLTTSDYELVLVPYDMTLTDARAVVQTAPTGAAIEVDVTNLTQTEDIIEGTPLTIDAEGTDSDASAAPFAFENTAVSAGDLIKVAVTQVGATTAGQDLAVILIGNQ